MLLNRLAQSLDISTLTSSPIIPHAVFLDGQIRNCFTVLPYVAQNQFCHVPQKAGQGANVPPCCLPCVVRNDGS